MKTEIAERWLAALRGGEYKQTRNTLRVTMSDGKSSFCCLGVLCDLHSKETGVAWDEEDEYRGKKDGLPKEVILWAGLEKDGFLPNPVLGGEHLSVLNDGMRYTFVEIADVIDKQKDRL